MTRFSKNDEPMCHSCGIVFGAEGKHLSWEDQETGTLDKKVIATF